MRKSLVRTSRFLSLVLRHKPETIGIALDGEGWVDVAELLARAKEFGRPFSREELEEVVRTNDKRRFVFSRDGLRIRAAQGHSIPVDLRLEPATPPSTLYHGTVERFLGSIAEHGLEAKGRNHVHLSEDQETARAVGTRRGSPVVLQVDAAAMHADGIEFFLSENGVWLTDRVPPGYIRFP